MSDTGPGRVAWGDDPADLRAVVDAQRATIARLQAQHQEDLLTIARLEAALRRDRREDAHAGPPTGG